MITNEDGLLKRAVDDELLYPRFSILNPELCFTLSPFQVACGAADIMAHLMERYFTTVEHVEFTDRLIEATMKTVALQAPRVLENRQGYDAWSELMWAGTVAHNNLLNTGRTGDWASHQIEHELSGIYDVAHGAGLAVVFPAWMKHVLGTDVARFAQWSARVWNVDMDYRNPEATAREGIRRLEAFFRSLGLGTKLGDLMIGADRLDEMADKCTDGNTSTVGNFVKLDRAAVREILELAL
ncbi:MAG: iron-containing alcohol dehydrogenase [Rhodoferax sp.]